MFKEKGYDEFLAENIQQGLADSAAGRVFTLEECTAHWQQKIERQALELALLDEELSDELNYA